MMIRSLAVVFVVGTMATSQAAMAQSDVVSGAVAGAVAGVAIATGVVPLEHREPLHEYIVRENRPSYVYSDEVVVGRTLPPGAYETYPVPERYGVPGHHYTIVNGRAVVLHPETRRIVHVYDY